MVHMVINCVLFAGLVFLAVRLNRVEQVMAYMIRGTRFADDEEPR